MCKTYESEIKFGSMRKSATGLSRFKRTATCACGRPVALVREGHHWKRLGCCKHCSSQLTERSTALVPNGVNAGCVPVSQAQATRRAA
jgi:hypothetical protein